MEATDKHLPKAEGLPLEISEVERKRRLATYIPQKGEHEAKFIFGEVGQKIHLESESLDKKTTIFISNCRDCEIIVDTICTKIMVQGCSNTKLICNGVVLTNSVEIWDCVDGQLEVNEILVATLQIDLCSNFSVIYSRKKLFHKMIWAAVDNYRISFRDCETIFENGYQKMIANYPGEKFQENIAQFIDSVGETGVISEKLLRLQNGFPTTEREQEEFDLKSEKNKQLAEEHFRGLIKKVDGDEDLKKLGIKTIKRDEIKKKVAKPNDPCPCASSLKYKKCCGKKLPNSSSLQEDLKAA